MLSISFLLVTISLAVTGDILEGPPLCYKSCYLCLSSWRKALMSDPVEGGADRLGCGFHNGQELLAYYTMTQTSFVLFITVVLSIAIW